MIDPVTAFTVAVGAFNTVKKLVAAGKEIEGVVGQIGKWYNAVADFQHADSKKNNKKPPLFQKLLHEGSVESEALDRIVQRQKMFEMEKELRELISYAYGGTVYAEMLAMRKQIREERRKAEEDLIKRKRQFWESLFLSGIAAVTLSVAGYIVYVILTINSR